MKKLIKKILTGFISLYSVSFSDSDEKARVTNLLKNKRKKPALLVTICIFCASALLISLVSCTAEPGKKHLKSGNISNTSMILEGNVKAHNELFDLTVTSACVKNDQLELTYTIDLLQILNIDIDNAIKNSFDSSETPDNVRYSYIKYLGDIMSKKGYNKYFDLVTKTESGEYRLLSPKSSIYVNNIELSTIERNITESGRSLTYLGKEVWSLDKLKKANLDNSDTIVYRLGDDLSLTFSLTSIDALAISDKSSICTAYGVTIIAAAERTGDSITVDLYAADTGDYDDIIYNTGAHSDYFPYILTENGTRLRGTMIEVYHDEDTMHIGDRYKFDLSGRDSGIVTVGFPAIGAMTKEAVTIPITQDALIGKKLDIKAALRHSDFSAEMVEETFDNFNWLEHPGELEMNYTHTSDENGVVIGQFQKYSVNGVDYPFEYICYGYSNKSQFWTDVSPISIVLSCPYNEVREVVLKNPQYWLTDGFEFTFDLGKLTEVKVAVSDIEEVDEINTEHRREALAECWHGENKLKYICELPEFIGELDRYENESQGDDIEHYRVVCSNPTEQQARNYIQKVKESNYNIDAQITDELDKGGSLEYRASNADGVECFISYGFNDNKAYISIECNSYGDVTDWVW